MRCSVLVVLLLLVVVGMRKDDSKVEMAAAMSSSRLSGFEISIKRCRDLSPSVCEVRICSWPAFNLQ